MTDWSNINFPVQSHIVRREMAKDDVCPECGGALDTGWECTDCSFDAMPLLPTWFLKQDGK